MLEYSSQVTEGQILARIINLSKISPNRQDLLPEERSVQLSIRRLETGFKVAAHRHLSKISNLTLPVEIWLVNSGKILATIYDVDNSFHSSISLVSGDIIIFLSGGHSLEVKEGPADFVEIKSGPYEGVENDKQFI
jgi:hypothetical protein